MPERRTHAKLNPHIGDSCWSSANISIHHKSPVGTWALAALVAAFTIAAITLYGMATSNSALVGDVKVIAEVGPAAFLVWLRLRKKGEQLDTRSKVRVTVDLSPELHQRLEKLTATIGSDSKADTVRDALRILDYLSERHIEGYDCLLRKGDRTEIVPLFIV